jgi:hypothetical protein
MVRNQIDILTLNLSFSYNLCYKYLNGSYKLILDIYISKKIQWYMELFNPKSFDPCNCFLKLWDSNSQSGSPFGRVWVHSLTLFHIPESVNVTPGLHFGPTPFHAFALVMKLS